MAGKRGNSEGSIYQTKTGLWRASYTVYTADGVKRRYLSGKTRSEVSQKLTKAMADRDGGLVFDAGKLTVGEYLDRWLTDSVRGTVRESTYESYRQVVRNYLIPSVGRIKLKDLKPVHVRALYREKLDAGLSSRTVQYMHTILKKSLKDARRGELISHNPADAVDPPQVKQDEIKPMSADQVRRLLEAARGERLEAVYTVAVHTGMRPGELAALRWDDVDLEGNPGTVQVKRARSAGRLDKPKTPKSRRRIDLSPSAREALRSHRKRQLEERMERAGLWEDYGLVFPSNVGTPLDQRNLTRAFKAAVKQAGLPETFRLYDLRHTCATLLLSRNVHPKYVQELLGHASIALTLDTYSHVIPGMNGGTAGAMEDALG